MEVPTFYDDDSFRNQNGDLKKLKSNMTLDFTGGMKAKMRNGVNTLLGSPDLQMLKLASPDLEKLIMIQSNGMVNTTPTPTQFIAPKSVTEEQEAYARGFVDALAELHKNDDPMDTSFTSEIPAASTYTTLTTVSATNATRVSTQPQVMMTTAAGALPAMAPAQPTMPAAFTTTTQLPGSVLPVATSTAVPNVLTSNYQAPSPHYTELHSLPGSRTNSPALSLTNVPTTVNAEHLMQVKEEPQTVPDLSPIDMSLQEKIKLDRKRARNRIAARKCRTRKLERIDRLEVRVADLKGQNAELSATATALREQVCKLKQQIMVHVNSGCKVMLSPNIL